MIITNREEVIDKAFGVFVRMNYEKASIITLAKACGVTKTGIVYYFPHKLDLFMAVADKYVLQMHEPENKFAAPADTLTEFIGQYVAGVAASMKRIVELIGDNCSPHDCSPNFYYFHFLSQVRMYYPGIRQKIEKIYRQDYDLWEKVIQKAKKQRGNQKRHGREENGYHVPANVFRTVIRTSISERSERGRTGRKFSPYLFAA